jgi:endonuclease/exonuclease/phosphatase (EEP) superfamily protein YafD
MTEDSSKPPASGKKPWRSRIFSPYAILRLSVLTAIAPLIGLYGRHHWFLDLFNHLQAQYFVALLLATVTLLAGKRRRFALVPGLLMLIPGVRLAPLYWPSPSAPSGDVLRVATFNPLGSSDRYSDVAAWVLKTDPDFIYLPEGNADWVEGLTPLEKRYPHDADFPIRGNIGHCFRSKHPIIASEIRRLGKTRTPLLRVVLRTPQGETTVFAAHPLPPVSEFWATEQDIYLKELTRMSTAATGHAVVLGDLNATRWSTKLEEILDHYEDSSTGYGYAATWMRENWLVCIPIDQVFFRGFQGTRSRQVGPDLGSDHRPVVAELLW